MTDFSYDLVVIGSGPAGEGAAINAVKQGLKVAVVDERLLPGGNCTHLGTIPSKALRHSVRRMMQYNNMPLFRSIGEPRWFSFPEMMAAADDVITKQVEGRTKGYARNRVRIHVGRASFVTKTKIDVTAEDGKSLSISSKFFLIATGSSPYRPDDIDFNHPCVFDSDTILGLDNSPRNIIIYGAGVIGCEYASIFSGLDTRVDLVNTREWLMSFLDDEISDALSYHLRDLNVMVRHNEEYERVVTNESGVTLELKSGKRIHAEALLWCNGRSGNTKGLGLENVGLQGDERGQLAVNEDYQTAVDNIYAVGDVIGWPSLAGAAYDQGRAAASHMCKMDDQYRVKDVATGIWTIPEISFVGKNESELTEQKIPYEIGRAYFKDTARAQISGEEVGMLKILFHQDTLEILGIHCFGAEAAEIIHIGQAIMNQRGDANTIKYFLSTTFNYPTMAEAYRIASMNGLNRVRRQHRVFEEKQR
ncbi:Si-specific NAD(P)(+) transhydrogenase [Porticoccaceae bacterium]|nr:Si-specific NAD(P)(+) transhydrogenase [Porticoccaceae bacterium]MDA8680936.1 Si-specific NAD(P)(+) transhydrogenase [Porticoccaceae bacterium]MDB2344138.1 Si-specific NAD(P)(+) transhydrogenase [Porticoccaceae bacterium]MDB2634727.1 Si-specific NAD(P)(+) transhydrogenase [Porticoccaceae bacterium]